jgi:hypothetical protein
MVRKGFLTYEQLAEILHIQKTCQNKLFGQIAVELEYIDDEIIKKYFRERRK